MPPVPQMKGVFGTGATFGADLNFMVQLVMGVALLMGGLLARQKGYAAHGVCQTTVLLLNLLMIALVMWPSFHQQVGPIFPRVFHKRYFAVATIHGALGMAAELPGLHIVMVAGTYIPPPAAVFQALEAVDASGTYALGGSSAQRPVDLLRLVYRTLVVSTIFVIAGKDEP